MALSVSTRFCALATRSSRNPNWMDSVGHALAHAGPRPLWMRSLQKWHFLAVPVFSLKLTTPKGQADTQYLQPLQVSWLMLTVPNSVRWMAPVGHALRQPASAQCLHTSDMSSHARSPFGLGCSMKRTSRNVLSVKCDWFWYVPVHSGCSMSSSFHCLQATWQARHPMHSEVSVNIARVRAMTTPPLS